MLLIRLMSVCLNESKKQTYFFLRINSLSGQFQHVIQGCYRVLVSLKSWPGQHLSLNPCTLQPIWLKIVIIGENKTMHKKYNIQMKYCWSYNIQTVRQTLTVWYLILLRDISIAQQRLTQALDWKFCPQICHMVKKWIVRDSGCCIVD